MSTTGNQGETNFHVHSSDEVPHNTGIQDVAPSQVGNPDRIAFDGHEEVEGHGEVEGKYKRRKPHNVTPSQMRCNIKSYSRGTNKDARACGELCPMVINDQVMFKYVDRPGFRHFLSVVCPKVSIPSKKSLAKGVLQLYIDEKLKLKSFLKESSQRVCIGIDTWKSAEEIMYVCLTVHFIDNDWQLHKKILNFRPITEQTGKQIGKVVTECIQEWGFENIYTITFGDFFDSDDVVSCLKTMMDASETSILGNQYVPIRCISSLINQAVHNLLRRTSEWDTVDCIRGAIMYVKSTPVRYESFSEFAEFEIVETNKLLCLDVPNRWDSTYLMLESATSLQNAFSLFEKTDGNFKRYLERVSLEGDGLTYDHWETATYLVKFMGHLYEIARKISGSSCGTSNSVFHEVTAADLLLKDFSESDDFCLKSVARGMKKCFDENLGSVENRNKVLYFAVVLDPRYKLEFLEYCFDKMYDAVTSEKMKKEVKEGITSLFDEYKRIYCDVESCSNFDSSTSSISSSAANLSNHELADRRKPSLLQEFKRTKRGDTGNHVKSELDRYLAEKVEIACEENDNFNILLWWKVNARRYPVLSKIARDVLAVPFCIVPSEATFNRGVRVLEERKSSLLPKTIEAIVCVEDWFREVVMPVSFEDDIHEAHWLEKELSNLSVASSLSSVID